MWCSSTATGVWVPAYAGMTGKMWGGVTALRGDRLCAGLTGSQPRTCYTQSKWEPGHGEPGELVKGKGVLCLCAAWKKP